MQFIESVVMALVCRNAVRATKFVSPKQVIRATRRRYRAHGRKVRSKGDIEIVLTVGRPNLRERRFIALCRRAREPFPVKKIKLSFPK